jgi:hypothetical protein
MIVMKCPYYISNKHNTISCEGCIRYFPVKDKKQAHIDNYCSCDDWLECGYAKTMEAMYKEIGKDLENEHLIKAKTYLQANRKGFKKLLQQIGMLRKHIATMESAAQHNYEMYAKDRERFNRITEADKRSVNNLELCIAYALSVHGETEIDLAKYKEWQKDKQVAYYFDQEKNCVVYKISDLSNAESVNEELINNDSKVDERATQALLDRTEQEVADE